MNNKFNYQVLTLFLVAALLLITPFLPTSSRTTYLYFILNLLIIAVGAEAGLLSAMISKPPEEIKKQHSSLSVSTKPVTVAQEGSSEAKNNNYKVTSASAGSEKKGARVVEKSASEKIACGEVKMVDHHHKMKKCPSMPSLFFIEGGETEAEDQEVVTDQGSHHETSAEAEEEEEVIAGRVLSGQELFTKAEDFIGNFYMQLKMQREESWKKIHGIYQKAY